VLGEAEARERITALVGETTIAAAFAERHLIAELPVAIWRQLDSLVEQLSRLPWDERLRLCATQSELMRRLLVLLALDCDATVKVIRAKLGE
jgi:hypothetical protein